MLFQNTLGCDVLDEAAIAAVPGRRGRVYRKLPTFVAQAVEAGRLSRSYDVVVTWSERHTVAVAALFAVLRLPTPHLALMFWLSKPSVRLPLRVFRSGVDRIITWSSVQRDVAVERIGFGPETVVLVRHPVDQEFFRPEDRARNILFSAGSTQRDFDTLVAAARGLGIPLRIAASLVVALNGFKVTTTDVRQHLDTSDDVEVESLDSSQLRASYAEAKVVVVPLLPTDIDAGVNVILEGMAMGRPVISTRTAGQIDVIQDGETGMLVPPGDVAALRAKIEMILNDPHAAEDMGRRGRAYVEKYHRLEDFIEHVRASTEELAGMRSRGWLPFPGKARLRTT
ncbi:glycosyltransferase family 4 protein [Arthrobacter sp. YAF17]|uniref:glycosyltransferase family 4 protein n=1 Tax=Arthrobacter sp. YAF17 TaxID=3233077 RepID=UPI003F8DC614